MLRSDFLNLALENLCFKLEIHLFATNINTQFGKYAAFRPEPGTMYIDAKKKKKKKMHSVLAGFI